MGWYVDVSVKLKSNIKLCASIVLALVEALKLFSSLFRPWNLVKPDLNMLAAVAAAGSIKRNLL